MNAKVLGWQDRIGSIDQGAYADVVAVSCDSLADITELLRHITSSLQEIVCETMTKRAKSLENKSNEF